MARQAKAAAKRGASASARKPVRKTAAAKGKGKSGLTPWLLALVAVMGAISLYDHRKQLPDLAARYFGPKAGEEVSTLTNRLSTPPEKTTTSHAQNQSQNKEQDKILPPENIPVPLSRLGSGAQISSASLPPATGFATNEPALPPVTSAPLPAATGNDLQERPAQSVMAREHVSTRFYFCGTSGVDNCVVDGASFWVHKTKVRLADIQVPALTTAPCREQRDLAFAAKLKLRDLLNAGVFDLTRAPAGDDQDNNGWKLRIASRDGRSLGAIMVDAGLAHAAGAPAKPWC